MKQASLAAAATLTQPPAARAYSSSPDSVAPAKGESAPPFLDDPGRPIQADLTMGSLTVDARSIRLGAGVADQLAEVPGGLLTPSRNPEVLAPVPSQGGDHALTEKRSAQAFEASSIAGDAIAGLIPRDDKEAHFAPAKPAEPTNANPETQLVVDREWSRGLSNDDQAGNSVPSILAEDARVLYDPVPSEGNAASSQKFRLATVLVGRPAEARDRFDQALAAGLPPRVEARGIIPLRQNADNTPSIRLGDLISLLEQEMERPLFVWLKSSASASKYVTFETLRAAGLEVDYDAAAKSVVISVADNP